MRRQFPGIHLWAAFIGSALAVALLLIGAVLVRDWRAMTTPPAFEVLQHEFRPYPGGTELRIGVWSPPSPLCIRTQHPVLVPGSGTYPDGLRAGDPLPPGSYVLSSLMDGMGMGRSGAYSISYFLPPFVDGVYTLHNRIDYKCPIGMGLTKAFFQMAERRVLYIPRSPPASSRWTDWVEYWQGREAQYTK